MSRNTAVRAICMLGTYDNLLVEQAYNQLQSQKKAVTVESILDILQKTVLVDTGQRPNINSSSFQNPRTLNAEHKNSSEDEEESDEESTLTIQSQGLDPQKRISQLNASTMTRGELKKLKADNAAIRRQRQCQSCKERIANVLLLPCRHVPVCNVCIATTKLCPEPTCSMSFQAKINVFWP